MERKYWENQGKVREICQSENVREPWIVQCNKQLIETYQTGPTHEGMLIVLTVQINY